MMTNTCLDEVGAEAEFVASPLTFCVSVWVLKAQPMSVNVARFDTGRPR
jgi:hypothetical protein